MQVGEGTQSNEKRQIMIQIIIHDLPEDLNDYRIGTALLPKS